MTSDQSKYNSTSKSKEWFPFKKRKFNCWESPILDSTNKCSYKAEALLSFQERQMLNSIVNSLQTDKRDSIRISINELHRRSCKTSIEQIERSKSTTKDKGHTNRNQTISIRITKDDLVRLKDIAKINSLTNKEALRLVIIWIAKGIKDGTVKFIKGCQEISQDVKANEWKKNQSSFKQSESAKRLKEVRAFWKDYFMGVKEERKLDIKYSKEEAMARAMGLETADSIIEDRFEKIIEEHQLDYENLDARDQMIYSYMARYQLEYKDAVWWYEDELEEMDKIAKLSPYELVQYLKKEKEEEKIWNEEYDKKMDEKRMENMYGKDWRNIVPVKERNYWVLDQKIRKARIEYNGEDSLRWHRHFYEQTEPEKVVEKMEELYLRDQKIEEQIKKLEKEQQEMRNNGTEDERHPDFL